MSLTELAAQHQQQAIALLECAVNGHKGVNIAISIDRECYLCERCMTVYEIGL